jgi:hypothetical protein
MKNVLLSSFYKMIHTWVGGVAQAVECLPNKHKRSSNATKEKREKKRNDM